MSLRARLGGALAALLFAAPAAAATVPPSEVTLYRIDCGAFVDQDLGPYSDTMSLAGKRGTLTAPCYLIRHNDAWMLSEAGLPRHSAAATSTLSEDGVVSALPIEASLARLGLKPADIGRIGTDRAETLASFDRFKKLARTLGAVVIVEHVPADIGKLPTFPEGAV